jgi:hypothetical protein
MFTPATRVIIFAAGLLLVLYYLLHGNATSAALTLLGVSLVVWGYFKNGTVYLAWRKVRAQDFKTAKRILAQTKYPRLLKKQQRGFYHFTKGLIHLSEMDLENARINLLDALKYGVRTENNRAIIALNLADIEIEEGRMEKARTYLESLTSLRYNDVLEIEVQRIKQKLITL